MNRKSGSFKVTILDRYIFRELLIVFLVGLFILISILYLEKIHFLSLLILDRGITMLEFVQLLLYISPAFLVLSIPLSLLLASLITFSRLSADNEITAMRACGISFRRILLPVIAFSLLVYVADLYLAVKIQHAGNYKYIKLLRRIITEKIAITLGERIFFDRIKNTVIYVNEKPSDTDELKGIFIFDGHNPENPEYITSRKGRFVNVEDRVVLQLHDGAIYSGGANSFRFMRFGLYEMIFETNPEEQSEYVIQPREMSIRELKRRIEERKRVNKPYFDDAVEIYKRYSLPFSCIVLALLGAPLGLSSQRGSRWSGTGMGIVIIIVNYLLMMVAEGLGREGTLPPLVAMWMPNMLMGLLAIYLVWIASKEIMPRGIRDWIEPWLRR